MEELIARATLFITTHGVWAGPIIGVIVFGESLAVIGLFMPATALMLAIGGMIGSGLLDPMPIFLWAVSGAVIGDWISFAIGRRIGPSAYHRWPLNRHRPMVARARLFFRRYGFVSIFLGRFLGPIRSTIPLVAGVMDMGRRPFQIANITSAILWVPVMFAPGYLAATSLGPASRISEGHLIGAGLAVTVMTFGAMAIAGRVMGGSGARRRRRRVASAAK